MHAVPSPAPFDQGIAASAPGEATSRTGTPAELVHCSLMFADAQLILAIGQRSDNGQCQIILARSAVYGICPVMFRYYMALIDKDV